MVLRYNDANPHLCLEALDRARDIIAKGLNCVENVSSAWLLLESFSPENLPPTPSSRLESGLERGSRLADHGMPLW